MLAEKIGLLLEDNELARKMGQAGRRHVAQNFSGERMTDETIELYQEALSET